MAHLGQKPYFLYNWEETHKYSLEELRFKYDLDGVWIGHTWVNPLAVKTNVEWKTYAAWGLIALEEFPVPFPDYKFDNKNGELDCFVGNELASMASLVYKEGISYAKQFGLVYEERISWKNLPSWYMNLTNISPEDDWRQIRDDTMRYALPLEWQFYNISARTIIEEACNDIVPTIIWPDGSREPEQRSEKDNPYVRCRVSYVTDGFKWMNYILREDPEYNGEMCLSADSVTYLELLQWMITIMPPMDVDVVAYRYCGMNPMLENAAEGDLLTFRGYTSVSMNILKTINIVNWQAYPESKMAMMEIRIPAGSRFLVIPSSENEIILPHFCEFIIVSSRRATDDITYMVLDLVNDPTQCTRR